MREYDGVAAIDKLLGDQRRGFAIVLDAKYLSLDFSHKVTQRLNAIGNGIQPAALGQRFFPLLAFGAAGFVYK